MRESLTGKKSSKFKKINFGSLKKLVKLQVQITHLNF